jgi:hypothetical protein
MSAIHHMVVDIMVFYHRIHHIHVVLVVLDTLALPPILTMHHHLIHQDLDSIILITIAAISPIITLLIELGLHNIHLIRPIQPLHIPVTIIIKIEDLLLVVAATAVEEEQAPTIIHHMTLEIIHLLPLPHIIIISILLSLLILPRDEEVNCNIWQ